MTTIVGVIAASLTTLATLPQIIRSWKTKNTKDVSLMTYIILAIGTFLWIIYGWLLGEAPIFIANIVAFFFALSVLILKIRYG